MHDHKWYQGNEEGKQPNHHQEAMMIVIDGNSVKESYQYDNVSGSSLDF